MTVNQGVAGSSPAGGAFKLKPYSNVGFFGLLSWKRFLV